MSLRADYKQALADALTPDEAADILRELAYSTRHKAIDCRFCHKRQTIEVIDGKHRLEAIREWSAQQYGRPGPAEPTPDTNTTDLEDMDEAQLAALLTT